MKDMIKELDRIEKMNIKYIKDYKHFNTIAIIYTETKTNILSLIFKNYEEKKQMQLFLKKFILEHKTRFYIFCSDTLLTSMGENKKNKTYDCLLTMLCSPDITIQRLYFHDGKGNEIKIPKEIPKESINMGNCEWNIWNPQEKSENLSEIVKKYNEHKNNNKERFKGI